MKKKVLSFLMLCPLILSVGCSTSEVGYLTKMWEVSNWKQISQTNNTEISMEVDLSEKDKKVMTTFLPKEVRKDTLKFETKAFIDLDNQYINVEVRHNINPKLSEIINNIESQGSDGYIDVYEETKQIFMKELNTDSEKIWITKDTVTIPRSLANQYILPEIKESLSELEISTLGLDKLIGTKEKYITLKVTNKDYLEDLEKLFSTKKTNLLDSSVKDMKNNLTKEDLNLVIKLLRDVSPNLKKIDKTYSLNLKDDEIIKLSLETAYSVLNNAEDVLKDFVKLNPELRENVLEMYSQEVDSIKENKKLLASLLATYEGRNDKVSYLEEKEVLENIKKITKGTTFKHNATFEEDKVITNTNAILSISNVSNFFTKEDKEEVFPSVKFSISSSSVVEKNNTLKTIIPKDSKLVTDTQVTLYLEKIEKEIQQKEVMLQENCREQMNCAKYEVKHYENRN